MEIVKTNTNYDLADFFETWNIRGTVNYSEDGSININIDISTDALTIGSAYYRKSNLDNNVSINYNIGESDRAKFSTYFNTLIDSLLVQLNNK